MSNLFGAAHDNFNNPFYCNWMNIEIKLRALTDTEYICVNILIQFIKFKIGFSVSSENSATIIALDSLELITPKTSSSYWCTQDTRLLAALVDLKVNPKIIATLVEDRFDTDSLSNPRFVSAVS